MSILAPFQLLELNVISAQDLSPVSRSMRTYAVAWVHPDRKLSTRVDTQGHNNPTWNDKFVFRVYDEFLHEDTSAVMIEIYALHWFKDVHVGTVRILVGNVIPTPPRLHPYNHQPQVGMRFVALQVRRPSGRPQGILNIGVALLHSSMRSMPLYSQLSTSAVGYRALMGEEDPLHHHDRATHGNRSVSTAKPPGLRRTKSDTSSLMIGSEMRGSEMMGVKSKDNKSKTSSMINGSEVGKQKQKGRSRGSSLISVSRTVVKPKAKNRKAKSMLSGSEIEEQPAKNVKKASSILNGSEIDDKIEKGNASSVLSASEISYNDPPPRKREPEYIDYSSRQKATPQKATPMREQRSTPFKEKYGETPQSSTPFHDKKYGGTPVRATPLPGKSLAKFNEMTYGTPRKSFLGRPILTESELGPSPSEVAAAIAHNPKVDDGNESSILGWSLNGSVEGLQSKLERWRAELPPVYDRGELSSFPASESPRHVRRNSDGDGLFSCFSNICGCQCSIVCGGKTPAKKTSASGRVGGRSLSAENLSYMD